MGGRILLHLFVIAVSALAVSSHANGEYTGILDQENFEENMKYHFGQLSAVRHPRDKSNKDWLEARDYIIDMFNYIGLKTTLQCFNTSVTLDFENTEEVTGCNIIGMTGPTSTRNMLVIGADYDSSGNSVNYAPLRDNGAGVAMLLEVARAYHMSYQYKGWSRNYTTVFVAFDLNTQEQYPESSGQSGSWYFVHEWLEPLLNSARTPLGGALIFDSIATYNPEPNTQNLAADFKTVFPDAYDRINNDSRRGDYLAAVSPPDSESLELLKLFSGHYRMDRKARPYRLQELAASENSNFGAEATYKTLNHQASFHFWTAKPGLPCVLITDTDDTRQLPSAEADCVTAECDFDFASQSRMNFLYSTYTGSSYTVIDRQMTYTGLTDSDGDSGTIPLASISTLIFSLLIARLL